MNEETKRYIDLRTRMCRAVKAMIVDRLDLPGDPDWITDDQPLFGRGLELDSIDALELVSAIEYEFDVAIEDDDPRVFGSVNAIVNYIERYKSADELELVG